MQNILEMSVVVKTMVSPYCLSSKKIINDHEIPLAGLGIFETKTTKNKFLMVKLLPKIIFWIFLALFDHFLRFSKFKILGFFCTFCPISKQTADFSKKGFLYDDRLLMLYVLASIVFLYHQWSRWYVEMLERFVRQPGVIHFRFFWIVSYRLWSKQSCTPLPDGQIFPTFHHSIVTIDGTEKLW